MPNLAQPSQQIVLSRFGGLYTEADPRDLPMGASPRNQDVDFLIGAIGPRPGLAPAIQNFSPLLPTPGAEFEYVKSAIVAASGLPPINAKLTLAQSSDGILWQEFFDNPGILNVFYNQIINHARALSDNVDYVEFIGLSNLVQGNDQPRTFDGQFLDRVSQVGPGAGPVVASGAIGNVAIDSITQFPPRAISNTGTNQTLASVLVVPFVPEEFPPGGLFTIVGVTDPIFDSTNNLVNSIGNASNPNQIIYTPNPQPFADSSGGTAQSQIATVTTATDHNLMAGQAVIISGLTSAMGYDGTWIVFSTPTPTTFTFNAPDIIGDVSGASGVVGVAAGGLAAGPRYAIVMFVMRNGYITPASPPVGFTTFASDTFLSFTNIPIGPPACIGRIIAVTPANAGIGGPYYYIPNGSGVFTPTVIDDNTTTSLYDPSFSDAVLTAGIDVTTVGNNHLQMREVGEFVKPVLYAGRVFYQGERVKVDNLYNLTFDGGTQSPPVSPPIATICGWTKQTGFEAWIDLIVSPIYGNSLAITNLGGTTLNPQPILVSAMSATLSQFNINTDPFGVPTIRPNTTYSVRFTAWASYGGAVGGASVRPALVEHDSGTILGPLLPTLTQFPTEFVGHYFISPDDPPPTLDLMILPANVPPGETVYIDRIEIFPDENPVYANQLGASYLDNFQAVDSQTGAIDVSLLSTDPITNQFKFINTLYATTQGITVSTNDVAGEEPSGWGVNEVSNTVGCLGPLASDVGEEYVLVADRKGAYVFDGGNHVKFSQEIQQIWEQIYWPSANTTWIKNDIRQQRILIGVPMVLPNAYFPDATPDTAPSTPNIILCCSVLGLGSGSEIAGSPGVHVSAFTGQLLSKDMSRKWTGWFIKSPMANWINRPNGSEEIWFASAGTGNNAGTAQIYRLDSQMTNDDGAPILMDYFTYGFGDEATTQQLNLGQVRKSYQYTSITVEGSGGMIITTYPETLGTLYESSQPPFTLVKPAMDDLNAPLNETCNRLFIEFSTDREVNSVFNLRRMVLSCVSDPRIPVSGR